MEDSNITTTSPLEENQVQEPPMAQSDTETESLASVDSAARQLNFDTIKAGPEFIELCVTANNLSSNNSNPVSSCCVLFLRDDQNATWREQARTEVVVNNNSPAYATWLSIPLKDSKHLVNYWYKLQILNISGAMKYSGFRAISARAANHRSGAASLSDTVLLEIKEHVSNLCHHALGTRMEKSIAQDI